MNRFSDEARELQRRVQAGELPATSAWSLRDALAGDLMVIACELMLLEQAGTMTGEHLERFRLHLERMERKLALAAAAENDPAVDRDMALVGERQAAVQRGEEPALDLVQLGDALRQDLASLGAYVSIAVRRPGSAEIAERMHAALVCADEKTTAAFNEGWRLRRADG